MLQCFGMSESNRCQVCFNDKCILLDVSRQDVDFRPDEFATLLRYEKGQTLFQENEPAYGYFIVCHGAVKLSHHLEDGRIHIVAVLGPGDLIGMEAHATGRFRVEAEAMAPTEVGFVDRNELQSLVERFPAFATSLIEKLTEELGMLQERIWATARPGASSRLAYLLLDLARTHGHDRADGTEIDLALTREELGEMAGVSRETASLTLSRFAERGWIDADRRRIVVKDADSLQAMV